MGCQSWTAISFLKDTQGNMSVKTCYSEHPCTCMCHASCALGWAWLSRKEAPRSGEQESKCYCCQIVFLKGYTCPWVAPYSLQSFSMHRSACLYFSLYSLLFTRSNSSQLEHSWPWSLPPPPGGVRHAFHGSRVCHSYTARQCSWMPHSFLLQRQCHVLMILFAKLIRYLQTAFQRWNDTVPILKKQILYPREQGEAFSGSWF